MKQTEVDDGLSIVAILVEQLRDITLKSASAVRTFAELDVNGDPLTVIKTYLFRLNTSGCLVR